MKPVKRRPEWRWAVAASVAAVAGAAFLANLALSEISDLRARLEAERQPEAAVPWLLAPLGTQRGTAERLVVPPGARSIALLLDALNGDRVEIADAAGAEVWSGVVERIDSADEALVQLPAALMPPGEYDVRVWRGDALRIEFSVRIEAP